MDSGPELLAETREAHPAWRYLLRALWIAVRLIAVFYLGQAGERFFYQAF